MSGFVVCGLVVLVVVSLVSWLSCFLCDGGMWFLSSICRMLGVCCFVILCFLLRVGGVSMLCGVGVERVCSVWRWMMILIIVFWCCRCLSVLVCD